MARTYPPLPPHDDLLELFRESLANACDLISEAELLAGNGRFPRAHALATFAQEEVGKAELCLLAICLNDEITPRQFWEAFNSHTGKLMRVDGMSRFTSVEPVGPVHTWTASVVSKSRADHAEKLAGLYVDYRDGRTQLPSQITKEAAARQIESARGALALAERAFSADVLKVLLPQFSLMVPALKQAMTDSPDALMTALHHALHGSQDDLQRIIIDADRPGQP